MKKIVKIIGAAGAVALAAGLVPYHFKSDKESGEFELGGLLWSLKKTPGEEEDTYTMELLPFMDKEEQPETVESDVEVEVESEDAAAPAPEAEEQPEEPFGEAVSNEVVVESVDTKAEEAAPVEETAEPAPETPADAQ